MGTDIASVQQLANSVFAVIGADGLINFGIVKGTNSSAVLIDPDIWRIDKIDDALISISRKAGAP